MQILRALRLRVLRRCHADSSTRRSGAAHLMGRRQRPWGISVVTSSHMTTPKLKMSALELQGKPSRTCTRQQMPMSLMHDSKERSVSLS